MLSETDKAILRGVADNPAMLEAIKKVIVGKFSVDEISTRQSNELMGQQIRARIEGLHLVEEAFREIAHCATTQLRVEVLNPAR